MKVTNKTRGAEPQTGFSLIELLMAITIMMVLVTLGIRSVGAIRSGYELQSSSTGVMNQLELARQTARTQNRKVEVRFYGDSTVAPPIYREVGMWLISVDGTAATPLQKPFRLAAGIGISSDSTFSSLLPLCDKTGTDEKGAYRAFSFLPDGTMDTTGSSLPTLTLMADTAKAARPGELPPNFATIQIDPRSGRTKFFRP